MNIRLPLMILVVGLAPCCPVEAQVPTSSQQFNGLDMSLGNLSRMSNAQSRSISAENFTGEKGKGGMATEGTGKDAARELGQGWKVSPKVFIKAKAMLHGGRNQRSRAQSSRFASPPRPFPNRGCSFFASIGTTKPSPRWKSP